MRRSRIMRADTRADNETLLKVIHRARKARFDGVFAKLRLVGPRIRWARRSVARRRAYLYVLHNKR